MSACFPVLAIIGGALPDVLYRAGTYTRPLFSSTWAISNTQHTLNSPKYPATPPEHPLKRPIHAAPIS